MGDTTQLHTVVKRAEDIGKSRIERNYLHVTTFRRINFLRSAKRAMQDSAKAPNLPSLLGYRHTSELPL